MGITTTPCKETGLLDIAIGWRQKGLCSHFTHEIVVCGEHGNVAGSKSLREEQEEKEEEDEAKAVA